MTKQNMGGPAFPLTIETISATQSLTEAHGMTLWDHYAAAALTGRCIDGESTIENDAKAAAADAAADAMLAERQKMMDNHD